MAQQARYTTFRAGELEDEIRARGGNPDACSGLLASPRNGSRLRKAHSCAVRFPDGSEGRCRYERGGPAWHLFHFELGTFTEGEFKPDREPHLPRQGWSKTLGNDLAAIEAKARELAQAAFADAIERERREFFMRASEGRGRTKNPALYSMTARNAKRLAGRYALCRPIGKTLIAHAPLFATLAEANAAWMERFNPALVVACGNRLDRCWQQPRFNPLRASSPASLTEKGTE